MSTEPLSEREQRCLEHLRQARELEVSLAECARSFQVDVKELHNAKRALVHKRELAARLNAEDSESEPAEAGDFVPVRVMPSRPAAPESAGVPAPSAGRYEKATTGQAPQRAIANAHYRPAGLVARWLGCLDDASALLKRKVPSVCA